MRTGATEPTIAIVIPNFNDSRFLARSLRSVFEQAVPADEIIVVDDRSTDNSVELIRVLIAGRANARLLENPENLGTNGAINRGVDRSKSEYVLILSANDFVLPELVARAKAGLASAPGAGLWSAMAWLVDEDGRRARFHMSPVVAWTDAYLPPQECVRLAHRFGNWFTGPTVVYRRRNLDEVGRFDPAYMGLADLVTAWTVASLHGAVFSPRPLAVARLHARSYLSRTLENADRLEQLLARLRVQGPELSRTLFSPDLVDRTAARIHFAAVRVHWTAMDAIAAKQRGWRRHALQVVALLPGYARPLRLILAFLVLRPFDLLPTLWNRLVGGVVVRLRAGRALPVS